MDPCLWKPIPTPSNLKEFYYGYELPLARAFHRIEQRGVFTNAEALDELRGFLLTCLKEVAEEIGQDVHKYVAYSKKHAERMGWDRKDYINLGYANDVADMLEARGLRLPVSRITGNRTTAEDALNQLFADTGDQITMRIVHAREYTKLLGTYVNALLHNGVLYCSYNVTGTVTGRRSSRKNLFGYGTNSQNIPKHSELGKRFRACITARPGRIFINCDQSQAEDWLVSGLIADIGGDYSGLNQLRNGVDRHRSLASKLFRKPEHECGKDTAERFMGKKTRHAGNYDMGSDEMARQMIKEGHTGIPPGLCAYFLNIFHKENPGIKGVFHAYVQNQLSATRMLRTPLGRERIFTGCRPFSDNRKVFKEAYSYIPQSSVGDNTGLGILFCEFNEPGLVVMDAHDAIVLEVEDNFNSVVHGVNLLQRSFDRILVLPNGLEIQIPIEFDIGYDLAHMVEFKKADRQSIYDAYGKCVRVAPMKELTNGAKAS